jgi:hypothetical protein
MPVNRTKTQDMKHVSFRMPTEVYQDYATVAASRGVDLSALLNWIMTEYRPLLLLRHAENNAAMLRTAMVGLSSQSIAGPEPRESLEKINKLVEVLQGVASKLANHLQASEVRPAA